MSGTEITVHVNRGAANTLESDVESVETDRRLSVVLRGHERPAHVHCRLTGGLDRVATIDRSNYFIGPGDVTTVPVDVDGDAIDAPVSGRVEVVTGYGSETVAVDVTLTPPPPDIEVDKTLTEPPRNRAGPSTGERVVDTVADLVGLDPTTLAVLALGIFAILIAMATAATIGGLVAFVGLAIVVGGVVLAAWLLLQ